MNRAVTIRCTVCGLEVTGALQDDGISVRPSDRARPEPGAPVLPGLCIRDAEFPPLRLVPAQPVQLALDTGEEAAP